MCQQLRRFRGREVDTAGDGFFAAFDGPARAVRCASAIGEAVRPLVKKGALAGDPNEAYWVELNQLSAKERRRAR